MAPAITGASASLVAQLRAAVGRRHVLVDPEATRPFRTGFRTGAGVCLAVARPGLLVEMWRVLQACVAADVAIIVQAANTGLTGGSTPADGYDREVVIVSTLRLAGVHVIRGGEQVICLPGSTLTDLERILKPLGREPHSVIGSSCIGASVVGGVCNNSGGALVRRGPAYTELTLYAQVMAAGRLELVNHLGVDLGNEPEAMLQRLEQPGASLDARLCPTEARASDHDYARHVRDIDADTPARFNADPRRLHEASGSAGKIAVFAVRLDTFAPESRTTTFYVGTNDAAEFARLRRRILASDLSLPIAAEYLHREAFDIAARYGKDTFVAIQWLGAERLPALFSWKARLDTLARRLRILPADFSERLLQAASRLLPPHLPRRLVAFRDAYEHHLLLKVGDGAVEPTRSLLAEIFPSCSGDVFECTPDEGEKAFLHRFVTAGAAVRYRAVHGRDIEDIVALDVALRRSERDWVETLPAALNVQIAHKLYYGHFLCHVFHQDYLVRKGHEPAALEHEICALLDARGAEYPAEHNVGHLYRARPALERHYRDLDPLNVFNPGVGGLPKSRRWGRPAAQVQGEHR